MDHAEVFFRGTIVHVGKRELIVAFIVPVDTLPLDAKMVGVVFESIVGYGVVPSIIVTIPKVSDQMFGDFTVPNGSLGVFNVVDGERDLLWETLIN